MSNKCLLFLKATSVFSLTAGLVRSVYQLTIIIIIIDIITIIKIIIYLLFYYPFGMQVNFGYAYLTVSGVFVIPETSVKIS